MSRPCGLASRIKETLRNIASLFVDIILVNMSFYIAYLIRFDGVIDMNAFLPYLRLWIHISLAHTIIFYFFRLYDNKSYPALYRKRLFLDVSAASVIAAMASVSIVYARRDFSGFIPSLIFALACVLNILFICGWRIFVRDGH